MNHVIQDVANVLLNFLTSKEVTKLTVSSDTPLSVFSGDNPYREQHILMSLHEEFEVGLNALPETLGELILRIHGGIQHEQTAH